ncbi:hypothetical protein [Bradyrhizobium ganzhouense]|uniref:hypothetical protein n=1 Tax=Bradyrhizobium ganzhouense TaxID=1179767 RepID=UPI003CF7904D
MAKAIELIVDGFVSLGDRQSLESLREHRRRLSVDLKSRSGFDYNFTIRRIEEEIAAIEIGLARLEQRSPV